MSDIYVTDEMIEQARSANLAEYFKSGGYELVAGHRRKRACEPATAVCTSTRKLINGTAFQ